MRKFLAVGAATGALIVAGCADSALATVQYSSAQSHSAQNGHHRIDQNGDVSLMGSDMTIEGDIGGDLSLIGSDLEVHANIGGGMSLVGSDIEFNGSVAGTSDIAGSDVTWTGESGDDVDIAGSDVDWTGSTRGALSIAGSDVVVDGSVEDDLDIAGSDVELTGGSHVGGDLSIAGSDLEIAANVAGNADLAGSHINITGAIDGRLLAVAYSQRGWQWSSNDSHQRVKIDGRIGDGSAVCARRVDVTGNAVLSGSLAVFAEEAPMIADGVDGSAISFEEISDRDCDELLEPYDR
ncbi:hypothetical protein [Hyphobacterium sp.]|uniref:hypothetical protein n=1 Tax=Hyphobacterium sp. TaxID=2004662 RepID=UPI003B51A20F